MPTNPFFSPYSWSGTQGLFEDLTIEVIQQLGVDVKYIPRTLVGFNNLFGDDRISVFEDAIDIEMYPKNVDEFQGEGLLFSKYGIETHDQMIMVVAKKRFEQSLSEKILTEENRAITFEDVTSINDESSVENEQSDYSLSHLRPKEGDLIYFPMVDKLFEILFVKQEELFYQFGRLMTYELTLETYEYSSERLNTGENLIDRIEDQNSMDEFSSLIMSEGNTAILTETSKPILTEDFRIENSDRLANNESITHSAGIILDVSEINPYGRNL